ncbi:MAG: hypothetical protein ACLGI6_07375 [Gammaproteobacteria bacterium]
MKPLAAALEPHVPDTAVVLHAPLRRRLPAPMLLAGLALGAAVLLVAWIGLRLRGYPLWVPFTYHESDVVVMLMYIKGLLQDGWPLTMTHLSAPFSYSGPSFPMQTSFDWLLIKAMSAFTGDPGLLINVFWLSTAVMSAWSAAYGAWQLRASSLLACACGLLYAFLPFAMMRFTHHLNLVYYLVPLHCLLAATIAGGPDSVRNVRQVHAVTLVACVLQGFDYVYYSFFAVLLFGVAALLRWRRGQWRTLALPVLAAGLVTVATAINLAPAMLAWKEHGKPPEIGYKSAAEAEAYGVKLRRLLLPHPDNPIRPLAKYAQKDAAAGFPLENENQTARLGLFGAFGMLLMLVLRLRRAGADAPRALETVSALGLATFLVITVGGFGAIINVLSVPDIRGYNRFSVFLSFFALVAAALWLQARLAGTSRTVQWLGKGAILLFALLSLRDQLLDARGYLHHQQANIERATRERQAVARLEQLLPHETLVLQLPFTGYPPISTIEHMESYDHARYSLWSQHLRWSWPSFSQRHRQWQDKLAALEGQALLDAATLSGFGAIWIDRNAYKDRGEALVASLRLAGVRVLDIGQPGIVVLDLREAKALQLQRLGQAAFANQARALLEAAPVVEFARGFYEEERAASGQLFRWSKQKAKLTLRNLMDKPVQACVRFQLAVPNGGSVRIAGMGAPRDIPATSAPRTVQFPLRLDASAAVNLDLSTSAARLDAPGDPRSLYFYVMAFGVRTLDAAQGCANE